MLSTALKTCLDDDNCDGFTFEHGKDFGYGCYKTCRPEDGNGYGLDEFDYYAKTASTGRIPVGIDEDQGDKIAA